MIYQYLWIKNQWISITLGLCSYRDFISITINVHIEDIMYSEGGVMEIDFKVKFRYALHNTSFPLKAVKNPRVIFQFGFRLNVFKCLKWRKKTKILKAFLDLKGLIFASDWQDTAHCKLNTLHYIGHLNLHMHLYTSYSTLSTAHCTPHISTVYGTFITSNCTK